MGRGGSGGRGSAFNAERSRGGTLPVREGVAAERGDVVSFSNFWSFGADDQGRGAAVASAAVRGDLEMLKDIFASDDCTIFVSPGVGVEEANLPDVLEHWTLREYVEAGISACCDRVKQTPEYALRVVVDGWTRIDGGF